MKTDKAIEQYLAHYAESEIREVAQLPLTHSDHVLVIPAFQETTQDLLRVIDEIDDQFLLIVVCNSGVHDTLTVRLHHELTAADDTVSVGNLSWSHSRNMLVVDRCTPARYIPYKQGVGLARKIGSDIALALIHQHTVSQPVIHLTDADAHLPYNYFRCLEPSTVTAAWIYPFDHISHSVSHNDHESDAMALYEASIHYYAAGLRWAGSPYAYTTVGSAMALSPRHYAEVRGFPKRNAGEDFHILNKLRKTGAICSIPSPPAIPIGVSARLSTRVPIGTGTAVRDITSMSNPLQEFSFYNPQVFMELNRLLTMATSRLAQPAPCDGPWIPSSSTDILNTVVEQLDLGTALSRCSRQSSNPERRVKAFHDWFDGLKTLRLIHGLRDAGLKSLPFSELTLRPPFLNLPTGSSPADFSRRMRVHLHADPVQEAT
ncbi:MAG: hypothetical protein AAF525_14595 [Pseudomonadota bacterium]